MRIVCPHCSHLIEVSQSGTPRDLPDQASDSTVPEGSHAARSCAKMHQRLGKLTLLDRLGAGSFGEVWKARDTELNRLVAVKIPHAGYLADGKDHERFLREARSTAVLRHPGIVPVHEVGHEEGLSYLICDFIEGLTLTDLLKTRRLTFTETAELIAQVAEALDYATSWAWFTGTSNRPTFSWSAPARTPPLPRVGQCSWISVSPCAPTRRSR
jgi:hypothetical protein